MISFFFQKLQLFLKYSQFGILTYIVILQSNAWQSFSSLETGLLDNDLQESTQSDLLRNLPNF